MYNKEQLKIIKTNDKFVYINAGAGTGKTTTIIGRINYLINNNIKPSEILSISFTNKAVKSLKEKLNNDSITCSTFHKFIYDLIKKDNNYNLFTNDNNLFLDDELNLFSKYKNKKIKIKPLNFNKYQTYLDKNNLIDFDDIFLIFLKRNIKTNFKYIFVDEFQDTNLLQYLSLKKLINSDTSVLAVGDIRQAIYSFRGANKEIINLFKKEYSVKTYNLLTNYRSLNNLVSFSNKIIKNKIIKNDFRDLLSYSKENGKIFQKSFKNSELEAKYIVFLIKQLLQRKIKKNNIAIIAREEYRLADIKKELYSNYLNIADDDNQINLLTIHKAKGLEFDAVFLVGLEKGIFPNSRMNSFKNYLEEKRLFYVAITRARKYLFLTRAKVFNNIYRPISYFYLKSFVYS